MATIKAFVAEKAGEMSKSGTYTAHEIAQAIVDDPFSHFDNLPVCARQLAMSAVARMVNDAVRTSRMPAVSSEYQLALPGIKPQAMYAIPQDEGDEVIKSFDIMTIKDYRRFIDKLTTQIEADSIKRNAHTQRLEFLVGVASARGIVDIDNCTTYFIRRIQGA